MLRDHFHPPLQGLRHWEAFHAGWANNLATELNRILPPEWFAEPNVHFGIQIAPDVSTWEMPHRSSNQASAVYSSWTPESSSMTLELLLTTDIVQVDVFNNTSGPLLAGAIDLVSPSNKDRREAREAFSSKCESQLHEAIGLIVTDRHANLHVDLLSRLGDSPTGERGLYACAYRPTRRDDTVLDIWHRPLTLGEGLPTLPLSLRDGSCVPVDLCQTYQTTCEQQRYN